MTNAPYLAGSNSAASGGSTTLTVTASANVANNDSLIVAVMVDVASVTVTVGPDSQGNTYSLSQQNTTVAATQIYIFECDGANPLTSGVDTIPIVYSANTSAQAVIVVGDNNVTGQDKHDTGTGTSTAPNSGTTPTLSQAEEHAIGFIVNAQAGGVPTWAAPWSSNVLANVDAGTTTRMSAAMQTVAATTGLAASGTITSAAWCAAIITTAVTGVVLNFTCSDGVEGEPYSQTLTGHATGGSLTGYTFSIVAGALPAGVSLSGGVISGTPTASGLFNFTIQTNDSIGRNSTSAQQIWIQPNGLPFITASHLEGNLLTRADSDFTVAGSTWAADVNANAPAVTTNSGMTGASSTTCLRWSSAADGLTQIHTGTYPVAPNKGYTVSGIMLPVSNLQTTTTAPSTQIGVEWYTSGMTLIRTDLGYPYNLNSWDGDFPASQIAWQAVNAAVTSPSNAAFARVVATVATSNAGDMNHIDLVYFAQCQAQILIDFNNGTNGQSSPAGQNFMDITPWVRMDQGINLSRGRQDSISEIQAGSNSFQIQNDNGYFTRFKSGALVGGMGGDTTLQRRCQINLTDENGVWHTRADGPVSAITYTFDNTGNTNIVQVSTTDVLAPLNREDTLSCWTRAQVLSNGPLYHWALNDTGTKGGTGIAAETSGSNGPPLRLRNSDGTGVATVAFGDSTGGVETLADAISPKSTLDGSEYWTTGVSSMRPGSDLRGLDSGVLGPLSTPLPNVRLVPVTNVETTPNQFVGNLGYALRTGLANEDIIAPNFTGSDYSFEIFFIPDPFITTNNTSAHDYGPYVMFSLADSGTGHCLLAEISPTNSTGHLNLAVALYNQYPSFSGKNFTANIAPTAVQTSVLAYPPDTVNMVHHLVATITGDPSAPTVNTYMDGNLIGSFPLAKNQTFDTIVVGSEPGCCGCFYGNLSCFSIYNYALTQTQIIQDCRMGQYGMWEATTDNAIARLATFANIPTYWNNLSENYLGLSLTEYYDISGSNALASMQAFEQAEQGLLFVDASGLLQFHPRDWRMAYGAPDLLLPPDTFDADMGYEVIDQYMTNEQGVASAVFSTGTGYINQTSQDEYGTYSSSSASSPTQLPVISWSRAYAQLGLLPFTFWTTPYMDDFAAFAANARSDPYLLPGQLTFDIETLSKASTGIGISNLYALEIDNMIAPSGTLPASWPDQHLSYEWFIEGINETITNKARTIQFYTSPAESQRCWIPGDATYGVLGSTTRLGVSGPDTTGVPVADGKDVLHDAGGPYTVPSFGAATLNNPGGVGNTFIGANDIRGLTDNMRKVINPPMWCVGATATNQSVGSGQFVNTHVFFDNIYIDSEGGMGLVPQWPNWYCVTVPGYYDLDGVTSWEAETVASAAHQTIFLICQAGAQGVAAGTRTPTANLAYVNTVGSQVPSVNSATAFVQGSVSQRVYLGVGDMVALAMAQDTGTTFGLSTKFGGSMFSGVWRGFAAQDDRSLISSTTAGGTITGGSGGGIVTVTKTYLNDNTYSYYGSQGSFNRRNSNGNCYQGDPQSGIGSETSQISFRSELAQMQSDAAGNTVTAVTLTGHNLHTWYGAGGNLLLGWGNVQLGAGGANPATNGGKCAVSTTAWSEGATQTITLPTSFATALISGGMTFLQMGAPVNDNLHDYGYWSGGPHAWTLKITYKS